MPKVTAEHRAARREQILAAAFRCVAQQGFHKTTMAAVVAESGLSAGAVYGYFKGKDELILAIADHALGAMGAEIRELTEREPVPTPVEAVRDLTATLVERAEAGEVDFTRVAIAAWAEAVRDESVRKAVAGRMEELRTEYAALVRRQQQAGLVDAGADPREVVQVLIGLMPGFLLQRLVLGDVTPDSYGRGLNALVDRATGPA